MEPVSATAVAVVGFAASIATLSAVVVDSCKTIHNLWHSLKDAPEDIHRLLRKMKTIEQVILEMGIVAVQFSNHPSRINSQQCWVKHIEEMVDDWTILNDKINKLRANLSAKSSSGKNLRARVRKFFSEDDILKYENILSGHLQLFIAMCSVQSRYGDNSLFLVCYFGKMLTHRSQCSDR